MIFRKVSEKKATVKRDEIVNRFSKLTWIEIPANNLNRAVIFYEKILKTKMDITILYDKPTGVFNKYQTGISGCIVQSTDSPAGNGIKLVFFVDVMHEAIKLATLYKGELITEPFILKQKNEIGDTIIGSNLIDNQIGYLAEIKDSEGNNIYLYSHS